MSRVRVEFWLDRTDDGDVELLQYIQYLKDNREFITTMRRALRLVGTLDVSSTEELLKQYPWIVDVLKCNDESDLDRRLNELKELIMNNPQIPAGAVVAKSGFKPLSPPLDDDDDTLTIHKDANAGSNLSANFLGSAFGFQGIAEPAPKTSGGIKSMNVPNLAMPTIDDDDDDFPVVKH